MGPISSIIVYCVPQCGHARTVLGVLRRRGVAFEQRPLTLSTADEVTRVYHLYGSPILVINGEVIAGMAPILARVGRLAAPP